MKKRCPHIFKREFAHHEVLRAVFLQTGRLAAGWVTATLRFLPGMMGYQRELAKAYINLKAKYNVSRFQVGVSCNLIMTSRASNYYGVKYNTYFLYYGQYCGEFNFEGGKGIHFSPFAFFHGEKKGGTSVSGKRKREFPEAKERRKRSSSFSESRRPKSKEERGAPRSSSADRIFAFRERSLKEGEISGDKTFLLTQAGDAHLMPEVFRFSEPMIRSIEKLFPGGSPVRIHSVANIIIMMHSPLKTWKEEYQKGIRRVYYRN